MDEHSSTPDSEHTIRGSNGPSHQSLRKPRLYELGDRKHKASPSAGLNPAALPFSFHSPRDSSTPGLVFEDNYPSQRFRPPPQVPEGLFPSHTSTFILPVSPETDLLVEAHDDCPGDDTLQVSRYRTANPDDRKTLMCFVDPTASFHQTVLWCQGGTRPTEQSHDLWCLVPCDSSGNN